MPLNNKLPSFIHTAAAFATNTATYAYYQVYASVAATPTINGTAIAIPAGATIDVVVRSISATANVFVLGDTKSSMDPGGTTGKTL